MNTKAERLAALPVEDPVTWTPRHEREAFASGAQLVAEQIRKGLPPSTAHDRLTSLTFFSEDGFRHWLATAGLPPARIDLELSRLHERMGTADEPTPAPAKPGPRTHYAGPLRWRSAAHGIVVATRGFPVCCSGRAAIRIADAGTVTRDRPKVTCSNCRSRLVLADAYSAEKPRARAT